MRHLSEAKETRLRKNITLQDTDKRDHFSSPFQQKNLEIAKGMFIKRKYKDYSRDSFVKEYLLENLYVHTYMRDHFIEVGN